PGRNGRPALVVCQYDDLTQVRRLEASRDEFISAAAHELRTPLTALLGQSQLLMRLLARPEPPRERLQLSGGSVLRSAGRLNMLVNRLLDISRLEQGRLRLVTGPADLVQLAQQAVEDVGFRAADVQFSIDGPPELPGEWDADRVEQV